MQEKTTTMLIINKKKIRKSSKGLESVYMNVEKSENNSGNGLVFLLV